MDHSKDELKHSDLYDNIKTDVHNKIQQRVQPKESKKIGLEKLSPFLENLQTISNHNLAVATQTQQQNQYIQSQLVEYQSKNHELKKKLHKSNKQTIKLQQLLQTTLTKLNNDISLANQEIQSWAQQCQLKDSMIAKLSSDNTTLQQRLSVEEVNHTRAKEVWMVQQSQLSEEVRKLHSNVEVLNNELQTHLKVNSTQQVKLAMLQGELDRVRSVTQQEHTDLERKNTEWLAALKTRETKLENEIRLHESHKAELALMTQQHNELQDQVVKLTREIDRLKNDNTTLSSKNEKLQTDAELHFREKIKDINESFIVRLTNLEAQLQISNQSNEQFSLKIGQLTHQLKVSEHARDILQRECEQFEVSFETLKREKEMYLNEFRNLKEKYQLTIDRLEHEVQRLQLTQRTVLEDNKSLNQQCDHYRSRMQELLDLHELAALDQDESFYHVLQMLKVRGMEHITKEEMQMVRQDAVEHIGATRTANIVKQQLQSAQFELQVPFKSEPVNTTKERDQWAELYDNIDQIGR